MSISDNPQYRELEVVPGTFIPDVGIDYPTDDPFRGIIKVVKVPEHTFEMDEHYPYYDQSPAYLKERRKAYFICNTYCKAVQWLKWGFKVKNRGVMKRHAEAFRHGALTVCNHAYRWDMVAVIHATGKRFYIPMLGDNMMTRDYWYMRYIGGIPVPSSMAAMKKYNEAFDKYHEQGEWIHVFPEAKRWSFYKPLKPFRKGAFSMAYKYGLPILPCCITYRKRTGLHRLFGKACEPLITIELGEPIFPNSDAPRKAEVERLRNLAHAEVCRMAGIVRNPWPAAPADE